MDVWMYLSGVIYIRYMYVSIGNTTDIKLADRFSRAVNFSFFDKVTRLAGWQVVFFFFFQSKDKNKICTQVCILPYA